MKVVSKISKHVVNLNRTSNYYVKQNQIHFWERGKYAFF